MKREKKGTSKTTGQRQIALLFLAHNGIAQPDVWLEQREELKDGDKKILFFALTPPSKREEGWTAINLGPTKWCDASLVFALQDGIRYILKHDPEEQIRCIYFLPGQDLPLVSAASLYATDDGDKFCFGPKLQVGKFDWVKELSPWGAYSRKDAQIIANAEFKSIAKVYNKEFLVQGDVAEAKKLLSKRLGYKDDMEQPDQSEADRALLRYYYDQTLGQLERLSKESKSYPVYNKCPDQVWPSIALQLDTKSDFGEFDNPGRKKTERCTHLEFKPRSSLLHYTPSPHEWQSWDAEIATRGKFMTSLQMTSLRKKNPICTVLYEKTRCRAC